MTFIRSSSWLDVVPDAGRTIIHQAFEQLRDSLAKRRVYKTACYELSQLDNRDLTDLGIPRSDIRKLAKEATYGR